MEMRSVPHGVPRPAVCDELKVRALHQAGHWRVKHGNLYICVWI